MRRIFTSKFSRVFVLALLIGSVLGYLLLRPDRSNFAADFENNFDGKVIVVGAGASGLTAAYLLEQQGIEVQIIEAQDVYGGRMRESNDFADFPIDLGAEWIHDDPSILEAIVGNNEVDVAVETISYSPRNVYEWDGELHKVNTILTWLYSEYKFKDTTWFNFFETYIVPPVKDKIVLGEPVASIDYSGDQVTVSTVNNTTFEPANTYTADRVIVTVPITVLQNNYISFTPELEQARVNAINSITVPEGIKVFFEFSEKFYPDMLAFTEYSNDDLGHEKLFYDAAFGKDTDRNILGLFTVGPGANEIVELEEQAIVDRLLAELDEVYDGKASETYIKHIVQNWSSTQFIEGAYSTEFLREQQETIDTIATPLDNKVFFAGEALSFNNQATVHGAAESGYTAVRELLKN